MNMLSTTYQHLAFMAHHKQEKGLLCSNDKHKSHKKYYSLLLSNHNTDKSMTMTKPQLTGDKEWVNSVYVYNKSVVKPLVAADMITEKLVKSYFNFDIPHEPLADEIIRSTHSRNVTKRFSFNKMLSSKAEIKHFNDKGVITVFLYNRNSKVTEYKIRKEFSLVYKPKKLVKNKNSRSVSLLAPLAPLALSKASKAGKASNKKQNRNILISVNKKNVYFRTRLARVKKMWETRLLKRKSRKLLRLQKKARLITYFNHSQLELYKLNPLLLTNKAKQNEQIKFFSLKFNNKKKISSLKRGKSQIKQNNKKNSFLKEGQHLTKQNKHSKPYSYRDEMYDKYYVLKKVLLLDSAQRKKLLPIKTMKFFIDRFPSLASPAPLALSKASKVGKNLITVPTEKKLLTIFNTWRIFSFDKIIRLYYVVQKIYRSRKLSISRKNDIVRLIESNIMKKYKDSNLLPYSLLASPVPLALSKASEATQYKNENKDIVSYSNRLDILEKHRKMEINYLYRKKQLYLYYTQKLVFNNNKLKNWFMLGVKSLLSKIYNKKIELNIVNLKYLYLNSDNLAEAISTKLMNRKNRLLKVLNRTIRAVTLPSQHKELITYINKTDNLAPASLSSLALSKANEANKVVENHVLNGIEHRDVNGVRIEASGRLTKRITASRSVFKVKYKGGLRDPEAMSYLSQGSKKKSSGVLVGHRKANIQYSNAKSKTIIGSFGLKVLVSSFNSSPANRGRYRY